MTDKPRFLVNFQLFRGGDHYIFSLQTTSLQTPIAESVPKEVRTTSKGELKRGGVWIIGSDCFKGFVYTLVRNHIDREPILSPEWMLGRTNFGVRGKWVGRCEFWAFSNLTLHVPMFCQVGKFASWHDWLTLMKGTIQWHSNVQTEVSVQSLDEWPSSIYLASSGYCFSMFKFKPMGSVLCDHHESSSLGDAKYQINN